MVDHWEHGGYAHPLPGYQPRCRQPEQRLPNAVKAPTRYSSGVNTFCIGSINSTCNDPDNYNVAKGTWFVPLSENHEMPIPPYPLFRSPNALYTPRPSYLNMVANDPDHPLHYMGLSNGRRF